MVRYSLAGRALGVKNQMDENKGETNQHNMFRKGKKKLEELDKVRVRGPARTLKIKE